MRTRVPLGDRPGAGSEDARWVGPETLPASHSGGVPHPGSKRPPGRFALNIGGTFPPARQYRDREGQVVHAHAHGGRSDCTKAGSPSRFFCFERKRTFVKAGSVRRGRARSGEATSALLRLLAKLWEAGDRGGALPALCRVKEKGASGRVQGRARRPGSPACKSGLVRALGVCGVRAAGGGAARAGEGTARRSEGERRGAPPCRALPAVGGGGKGDRRSMSHRPVFARMK